MSLQGARVEVFQTTFEELANISKNVLIHGCPEKTSRDHFMSRIKGVSEPINVFEVTGLGPLRTRLQRSAGRGYTKFVGREPARKPGGYCGYGCWQ